MSAVTVACVWTGDKYPALYVERLRDMVRRFMTPLPLLCVTDRGEEIDGVETVPARGLPGWWAKMALFDPDLRGPGRCLYFDLDTVICGDLGLLARWTGDFGICANFARRAGNRTWPCRYGSCVMSFGAGWGAEVWRAFEADRAGWIRRAGRYGDQWAIERLAPGAALLQDELPGFFLGYRDLAASRPAGCSVVCFGGAQRPDNCAIDWVAEAWR